MKKYVEILLSAKPLLPGVLEKRLNICGKADCRCKDKVNPQLHGPYYRLCYNVKGKASTVFVPEADAAVIDQLTNNYREARSNTQDLALEMVELYRRNGLQGMLNEYSRLVERLNCKKSGTKLESAILRNTRVSRDNWKGRALERKDILDKNRVEIRDLKASRDNWKNKAMAAQSRENSLRDELDEAVKQLNRASAEVEAASKKNSLQ
jgi:hypothetical protein